MILFFEINLLLIKTFIGLKERSHTESIFVQFAIEICCFKSQTNNT
jgi:hypothetical protein